MGDNGKKTPAKIGTLVYPFKKKAESGKVGAQPVGADDTRFYFQALSNASDGFYPIGANGQWHGGIHFDAQTGATLPQEEGIRCIGDGEVVAYQVESQYSSVEYSTGKALYSRGFTLVRHRLELPPAPATKQQGQKEQNKTAPASDHTPQRPDQKAEEPSLIFYSVYLHLLDWAGYQKLDAKKPRPGYWGDEIYLVGDKAFDQDRTRNAFIPEDSGPGINLRTAENQYAGFAPRGVKLKLGEENPRKKGYFKIVEVVSGTTYPGDVTGTYVFKGSSKSKEGLTPVGAEPTKDTVHVLPKPKPIKAGELIGYLGQYERYIDTNPMVSARPRSLTHPDVFTPDDIKGFIAKSRERAKQLDAKQKVLLKVDKGAKLALPTKADQRIAAQDAVVAVGTSKASSGWIQVRRGTLEIAERSALGTFDSATNSYPGGKIPYRFVGAQDSDAITQAAYNALGKDAKAAYTRRQVWVPTGTPVWVEAGMLDSEGTASGREMQAWSQFPLKVGQGDGPTANFVRVVAIKQLSKVVAEPDGTRWWEIDIGTADGSSRIGWVREKDHPLVTLCSPWDWPGFEIVEGDTSTPEQLYARHIDATKQARPDEQAALAAKAAEANGGPLFSRLCDAIDLDDDKVLTPEELRKALKQPWLADALSRLIIHHTSEWGTPAEQWNAIDKDIPEPRKADWGKEKERIQSLQWWDKVKSDCALPADAKVCAFHPVGIIGNFFTNSGCTCEADLTAEQLAEIAPSASKSNIDTYLPHLNNAFRRFGINSCVNRAHFLAQLLHESGAFKYTRELGANLSYDPWRGRGLIQITFETNYEAYGKFIGEDVTSSADNYSKLEGVPHSVLSAAWYWSEFKKINSAAEEDDFLWCTAVVNGAYNGGDDRLSYLNRAITALSAQECVKKNHDGKYSFSESKIYDNRKFSFAWGLWNDPVSSKHGLVKSRDEAISGYQRYLDLRKSSGNPLDKGWYGIGKNTVVSDYAEARLTALKAL